MKEFQITRRRLPHWQSPGSAYFITARSSERKIFNESERTLIFNTIKFHDGKKYLLFAAVVMPDHIHLLLKPMEKIGPTSTSVAQVSSIVNDLEILETTSANHHGSDTVYYTLSEIMHSIKSYTAHKTKANLWQHESFDRLIRNEKEFLEKMQYIVMNPVRLGLCQESSLYQWLYYTVG